MSNSDELRPEDEIARLRAALDAETERCLEVQTRLDRANAEFGEFVSMAAHDLRESLREVASFSQLMAETYHDRLDSDAGVFLSRIQDGTARMQSLLADVVDYWAADADAPLACRTDMEAVLSQALLCAGKQLAERSATVTHDPLPPVTGDFQVLTKVLHHLIRNAVEFCGRSTPQVHISATQVDLDWVFSVSDNGPGVDPAFTGRLFRAFRRLHGRDHPGNGLGLAFCKKAVESHGGRIWVESAPGAGATFYFTLFPAG